MNNELRPVRHPHPIEPGREKRKILTYVVLVAAGLLVTVGAAYGGYLYGTSGEDASVVDSNIVEAEESSPSTSVQVYSSQLRVVFIRFWLSAILLIATER